MNLEIREFQQAIINFANQSGLPIEVKRLCFLEIFEQIKKEADKAIRDQIRERDEKENAEMEEKE